MVTLVVPLMTVLLLILLLQPEQAAARAVAAAAFSPPIAPNDPLADPAATVRCDTHSRITLLSPLLVRAEFSSKGLFEDRASLAFVNRRLPVPAHTVANSSEWCNLTLTASGNTVAYRKAGGASLAEHELQVHSRGGSLTWHAAQPAVESANLGGTVYDLKGQNGSLCGKEMIGQGICKNGTHIDLTCGGNTKTMGDGASYCTQGVLTSAAGGVTIYDDSENTIREPEQAGGWWTSRWKNSEGEDPAGEDLYLFLHGTDHQAGLRSLASVSGRSAVPPRRFFGVWWSRWNK